VQDRDGAKLVFEKIVRGFRRLRLIWADGGYRGQLVEWVSRLRRRGKLILEIVKRNDDVSGFKVLPKRWIVERTFGWLGRWRRLSKDYEQLEETSETLIRVAMIGLMVRRLAAK
jgi:putative transposase